MRSECTIKKADLNPSRFRTKEEATVVRDSPKRLSHDVVDVDVKVSARTSGIEPCGACRDVIALLALGYAGQVRHPTSAVHLYRSPVEGIY